MRAQTHTAAFWTDRPFPQETNGDGAARTAVAREASATIVLKAISTAGAADVSSRGAGAGLQEHYGMFAVLLSLLYLSTSRLKRDTKLVVHPPWAVHCRRKSITIPRW